MKSLPRLLALTSVVAASFLVTAQEAQATLLTYWNFNNVSPAFTTTLGSFSTSGTSEAYVQSSNSVPGKLLSNTNGTVFNSSSIYIDFANVATITAVSPTINGKTPTAYTGQNGTGGSAGYGTFTGSTGNAVGSDAAGDSLLLLNTAGNFNNKYIDFSLSSLGYNTLSLTYSTRLTNAVTASQVWTYSLNGTDFLSLTTLTPTANGSFNTQTLNLSSLSSTALDNQSSFTLRMTYTSSNAQGSQAFDNLQLTGTASAVPEPSTFALLGGVAALGLALVSRRKRA
ncbi:MAG: PEP-CTERM sorting domain-containing protein [Opitutaceae bacterium]|jgi:hypothetical protein